mmetsp:Transcript_18586/g.30320  ORF Transcript_18586/g.30320 Transcript_18586/m.30320 type:complete len:211 (-) Transcript_18586:621-1253(-)
MIGELITRTPGRIISLKLALVEISMQRAWSGGACPGSPVKSPGMVSNWRLTSLTISLAAIPTDFMVIAENQYGIIAPIRSIAKIIGERMDTCSCLRFARLVNAPNRARPTRQADPIAKPFPIAAVVFPAASRASVLSRTSSGKPAISAIPPALSQTGPYTSIERQVASVPSIPRAARETPYMSKRVKLKYTTNANKNTGMIADLYPRARP